MNKDFLLSLIIPVYNEEQNIKPLLKRLIGVVRSYQYEVIFVDDGSKDETAKTIKELAQNNSNIKLITFMKNFGHQMALTAGYQHVKGEAIVTMDADLQDPPDIIPKLIEKWQKGAKIVYAKREKRDVDSWFKKLTAYLFYKFINFLSDSKIPDDVGDYRLLDKKVVNFLNNLPEHSRFLRGLTAWGGFPTEYVLFKRERRFAGETHYPFSKMFNFALEGITSFSTKPLRLATYFGFLTSAFSIFVIVFKSIQHFILGQGDWLPGWASLFFSIVFLGGVQLITIGISGEYIGKIYQEVQKRPQYLIKEKINING
ncbi:glycosyltransferase family 2 protein [Candidatus Roizmanbacteria bacterium]|nr:glycosyltransferase family 2 protein [Candidatus Roizmanbacteria bacterium]